MTRALIALGSNLGDREAHLRTALAHLERCGAARVVAVSRFLDTEPVGGPPQPRYLNGAAVIDTDLGPVALVRALKEAEAAAGRRPGGERWGPREADLDLLLFGDVVLATPEIEVPHPRMAVRRFVLEPAAEVAPEMRDPRSGRTVADLLAELLEDLR